MSGDRDDLRADLKRSRDHRRKVRTALELPLREMITRGEITDLVAEGFNISWRADGGRYSIRILQDDRYRFVQVPCYGEPGFKEGAVGHWVDKEGNRVP